jgi:hypothetical protein
MRDTLTTENASDFSARYISTIAWYSPSSSDEKKFPVFIEEAGPSYVAFRDKDDNHFTAPCDSGVSFEFKQAERGWYYHPNRNAYCICRLPARQWKRGIGEGNTQVWVVTPGLRLRHVSFQFELLAELFLHQQTITAADIRDQYKQNCKDESIKGIAYPLVLSRMLALADNKVYLYHSVVGDRSLRYPNTLLVHKHFVQEIRDALEEVQLHNDLTVQEKL